jgi:hypothetical protein
MLLERNQSKRALTKSFEGGFYFHPSDLDLSLGTPDRKKPLGGLAFGVQLLWFRCKPCTKYVGDTQIQTNVPLAKIH